MNATNETALALVPPAELVKRSREAIAAVRDVVEKHYIDVIDGKRYLKVAGAQAMATSLGYTTGTSTCRYIASGDDGVPGRWEAVATVMLQGVVVATGISAVFDDERGWQRKPHFARMGMASTRATGRALKGVMGWATALVGAEGSLSEEMPAQDATMPQEASAQPLRLAAPKAVPTPQGGNGARWVTAVVAAVENHRTGERPWWKIITEGEDGNMETFTCFKPKGAKAGWTPESLVGKRADLKLETKTRKDGTTGVIVVDAIDSSELPV